MEPRVNRYDYECSSIEGNFVYHIAAVVKLIIISTDEYLLVHQRCCCADKWSLQEVAVVLLLSNRSSNIHRNKWWNDFNPTVRTYIPFLS